MKDLFLQNMNKEDELLLKRIERDCFQSNRSFFLQNKFSEYTEKYLMEKTFCSYNLSKHQILKIVYEKSIIGGIIIENVSNQKKRIASFFIMDSFQNRGIGKLVIEKLDSLYPDMDELIGEIPSNMMKNVYFYVRKCRFSIIDIVEYNKHLGTGLFLLAKKSPKKIPPD